MVALIGIGAFVSTMLGGLFALRFKDKLHLILGFSAGAVVAVAFFDLIPEAIELGSGRFSVSGIMTLAGVGFIAYMLLDRVITGHSHGAGSTEARGSLGAASLAVHSFIDGLAVGLAFRVSAGVGAVVAAAVLAHDFSDGINTVNMIVKSGGARRSALRWLAADAIAPTAGIAAAFLLTLPETALGAILGVFAGFFVYIGASDLLPESHHAHPTLWTSVATVAGMAALYAAIRLAGV